MKCVRLHCLDEAAPLPEQSPERTNAELGQAQLTTASAEPSPEGELGSEEPPTTAATRRRSCCFVCCFSGSNWKSAAKDGDKRKRGLRSEMPPESKQAEVKMAVV